LDADLNDGSASMFIYLHLVRLRLGLKALSMSTASSKVIWKWHLCQPAFLVSASAFFKASISGYSFSALHGLFLADSLLGLHLHGW
jgi:hypothetical protein